MLRSEVLPGTNYYFVAALLTTQINIIFGGKKLVLIPPLPAMDKC